MLVELSINPLGRGTHFSKDLAEILKIIDDSGLRYCLTPLGTCIEGEWDEVMTLVKRCHERARSTSPHVLTTARIEDEEGAADKITENVISVENAAGRQFKRCRNMSPNLVAPLRAPGSHSVRRTIRSARATLF